MTQTDIADAEAAFIEWLLPAVAPCEIHDENDTDEAFVRVYRIGGVTDSGTRLDHPQLVVSCFGSGPPSPTPKHSVATTALDALARALDIKGQTVAGCVFTDAFVTSGIQAIPEPNKRRHYQFAVQLTSHPTRQE